MTAPVLIAGTRFRKPEIRTSKAGKPFVTATIKARDGEATQWWKLLAFSESVAAEIGRLDDGDAITAQGALKVETYDKGGETRVSLTCAQPVEPRLAAQARRAYPPNAAGEQTMIMIIALALILTSAPALAQTRERTDALMSCMIPAMLTGAHEYPLTEPKILVDASFAKCKSYPVDPTVQAYLEGVVAGYRFARGYTDDELIPNNFKTKK